MYRKDFVTELEIKAPAERVWRILTDFASYPEWNPMLKEASGKLKPGARMKVHFAPEGSRAHHFRPKLIIVHPNRELRWLGWPRFPRLFETDHYWIMEEKSRGKTHLVHGSGIYGFFARFASLGGKAVERAITRPFVLMNQAHKERAEGS